MIKSDFSTWENIKSFFWLGKLAYSFSKKILLAMIFLRIIGVLLPIVSTFAAAQILNLLASGIDFLSQEILIYALVGFGAVLLINVADDLDDYVRIRFNYMWEVSVWELFLNKTSKLDFQYLESPDYSIFMHKVKEAINWRAHNVVTSISNLTAAFIGLIFIGGIFIYLNPLFIVAILATELIRFAVNKRYGGVVWSLWDSNSEAKHHSWHAQHALEKDDVLRESKIYGFQKAIISRYKSEVAKFNRTAIGHLNKRTTFRFAMSLIESVIFLLIQLWLIGQVIFGLVTLGGYSFYLTNIVTVSDNLKELQRSLSWIFEQLPFISDFKKYLDLPSIIVESETGVVVPQAPPKIEFKNVFFRYPGTEKFILNDVSFVVEPGQTVAVIGENGAGKTTMVKLLARFYDVDSGEILINGTNIKELERKSYYKLWGVLFQSFAKFWFSVRENIGVSNVEDIDNMGLIKAAAEKTGVDELVKEYPNQYETLLSRDFEGGKELSGGQWQKLGIARAMFASPKLIVLDEPTSALDALAEAEVFKSINELAREATIVVISHRFATVRNANHIVVLKNGKVTEQGSHEQLIENGGLYSQMFNEQAKGYK